MISNIFERALLIDKSYDKIVSIINSVENFTQFSVAERLVNNFTNLFRAQEIHIFGEFKEGYIELPRVLHNKKVDLLAND